jgi:aspartyl-tRNA(Asn)/glutamyl-tRNA(Gln) amidotransferase subunit A
MNTLQKVEQIKSGKLSAAENISKYLEVIKKDNPKINAFLYINPNAEQDARIIDEKIKNKEKAGKLAGLAIAVKSNINVIGMPISCASKVLEEYFGTYDADVIKKIKEEDGIIIGITNCDEFASGSTGRNSAFGPTLNPTCDRVPGGSSSGSGAAVAASMCDISLGSDTGGSIRAPASNCGIFGIKPSYGRVSRFGLIDLAMSFDQIGPLSRDIEGCKLMLEVIAGYSENDPITYEIGVPSYTQSHNKKDIKIGLSKEFEELCTDKRIYEMVKNSAHNIVNNANNNDKNIHEVKLNHVKLAVQTYYPIVYVEFFSGTRKLDGRRYGKKFEDAAGIEALRRALGGQEISKAEHEGKYYRKALQVQQMIKEDFNRAFEYVDVIILPTLPALPPKMDEQLSFEEEYASDAFTIPANLAGICAGVVPIGKIDGVPVGLQVFAKAFNEEVMFQVMDMIRNIK